MDTLLQDLKNTITKHTEEKVPGYANKLTASIDVREKVRCESGTPLNVFKIDTIFSCRFCVEPGSGRDLEKGRQDAYIYLRSFIYGDTMQALNDIRRLAYEEGARETYQATINLLKQLES